MHTAVDSGTVPGGRIDSGGSKAIVSSSAKWGFRRERLAFELELEIRCRLLHSGEEERVAKGLSFRMENELPANQAA
jgi:hypothetical protein